MRTLFLESTTAPSANLPTAMGGHLPPIIMSQDGSIVAWSVEEPWLACRDKLSYEEESVELRPGEIFLAYTDGVTEPENEFGEFGEQRLIDLVRENRDLPLAPYH